MSYNYRQVVGEVCLLTVVLLIVLADVQVLVTRPVEINVVREQNGIRVFIM